MSTKIYNGYKMKNMTLEELTSFTRKVSKDIVLIKNNFLTKYMVERAVNILDDVALNREGSLKGYNFQREKFHLFLTASQTIIDMVKEDSNSQFKNGMFDMNFNCIFLPSKDSILVLLYTEQEEFQNYWEKLPEVEKYPYWNNSDPSEDFMKKFENVEEAYAAWDKRGEEWNLALGNDGWGIPAMNGLQLNLNYDTDIVFYPTKNIEDYIPSYQKRLERVASNRLYEERCEEKLSKEDSFYDSFEKIRKYKEWLVSEEGQENLNKYKEEYSDLLEKDITAKMLSQEITVPKTCITQKESV